MEGATAARAAHNDRVLAAIRWSALSLGWALLVGIASVAAGVAAHATSLVGFGLNSVVDGAASAMLVWRFEHERRGMRSAEKLERRAARAVGVVLLVLAVFLAVRASLALAGRSGPNHSSLGVGLTGASMLVLPFLATAKLRLARALESRALRADGVLSGAGATLAAAALIALVLNTTLHWWWADSVAAIVIAAALLREGVLTVSLGARGAEP